MIPDSKIKEVRKLLENAQNPIYFFDDDCDGTTSFLQLYKKYGGRGIISKEGKKLQAKYWDSVAIYNADLVVILDIPEVEQDFFNIAQQNNIKVVYVDHHPAIKINKNIKNLTYINPMIYDEEDNRSTAYWAAQITKDINWLAVTGTITDYTFAEDYIKKFSKERPDLISPKVKNIPEAMNDTKIGLLGSIINANVRGTVKEAMASVKTLTRIESPDEILDQTSSAGKYIWKKYAKHKKFYDKIKSQLVIGKEKIVYTDYEEESNSVSSALATEISSKNPDKVIVIARISKGEAFLSIRAQELNIRDIALEAMAGLNNAKGGGHDHAIGASMPENQLELFIKKLKDLIE